MVAGISALQKFNFFTKPVEERQAGSVNSYKPAQFGTFRGAEAGVSNINCEVTPKYLDTATSGTTYTNGRGYSEFGAFKPYFA